MSLNLIFSNFFSKWSDLQKTCVAATCSSPFQYYGSNCYSLQQSTVTWSSAKIMCESLGSRLVIINSDKEFNDFITYVPMSWYWVIKLMLILNKHYNFNIILSLVAEMLIQMEKMFGLILVLLIIQFHGSILFLTDFNLDIVWKRVLVEK